MSITRFCHYCNEPVDPQSRWTWKRVNGWGRRGVAGGSDITLREYEDIYACGGCISRLQGGKSAGQESFFPDAA